MKALERRLSELERQCAPPDLRVWHMVIVDGQSEEQALADYEGENGAVGPDDGVVYRVIVDPAAGSA